MSSRLFTEVRERRGLAYYVFGTNHGYTDAGSLYAQAGVDIKRIDEAVTTIVERAPRIAAEPVPADELEKARSFAKGRFVLQLESPHGTDHVRPPARGARGPRRGAGGGARRARRRHRARTSSASRRSMIDDEALPRRDRAVRRRRAVREAALARQNRCRVWPNVPLAKARILRGRDREDQDRISTALMPEGAVVRLRSASVRPTSSPTPRRVARASPRP